MNNVLFVLNTSEVSYEMGAYDANLGLICLINSLIMLEYESIRIITYSGDDDVNTSELIVPQYGETIDRVREFCENIDFGGEPTTGACQDLVSGIIQGIYGDTEDLHICLGTAEDDPYWIDHIKSLSPNTTVFNNFMDMSNSFLNLNGIEKVLTDEFNRRHLTASPKAFGILQETLEKDFRNMGWCRNMTFAWEFVFRNRHMLSPEMHMTFRKSQLEIGTEGSWIEEIGCEREITRQYIETLEKGPRQLCLVYDGPDMDTHMFIELIWDNHPLSREDLENLREDLFYLRAVETRDLLPGQAYIPLNMPPQFVWTNLLYLVDSEYDLMEMDDTRIMPVEASRYVAELVAKSYIEHVSAFARIYLKAH